MATGGTDGLFPRNAGIKALSTSPRSRSRPSVAAAFSGPITDTA